MTDAVPTIVLVGTIDTKGREYARLRDLVAALGANPLIIDVGIQPHDHGAVAVDVDAVSVARNGGFELAVLRAAADRGAAVEAMAAGVAAVVNELHGAGRLDAIAAIGGSGGTAIATAAMRALPFGVPKLMVSTVASGDVGPYVQGSDITMSHPVVDVVGENAIVESVLRSAAGAIVGMASAAAAPKLPSGRPTVAATMFGVTTPCVTFAREDLEQRGYEVVTFHATGIGGDAMERLIQDAYFDAVLDVTTTELADELVGGIHPAGPQRLRTAGRLGIPQAVSVGALDMVNFGPYDTVPPHLRARTVVRHNPHVTLVRTTAEECAELGARLAQRVCESSGPVSVYLPLRGTSMLSVAGQPFYDPDADQALFDAIREGCGSAVEVVELDCDINDPRFARAMADQTATWQLSSRRARSRP